MYKIPPRTPEIPQERKLTFPSHPTPTNYNLTKDPHNFSINNMDKLGSEGPKFTITYYTASKLSRITMLICIVHG